MPDLLTHVLLAVGGTVLALRLVPQLQDLLLDKRSPSQPADPAVPINPVPPTVPNVPLPDKLAQRPGVRLLLNALVTVAALTPNKLDDVAVEWAKRLLQMAELPKQGPE